MTNPIRNLKPKVPLPKFTDYKPRFMFGQGWVNASIKEIPSCWAQGKTKEEALLKLERTFGILKKSYGMKKQPLPQPS